MDRKRLLMTGLLASSFIAAASFSAMAQDGKRIAFFVSDLSNVFHQAQAAEAERYAAEKYGAEVVVFDGRADSAVMTQNIDQVVAGGFDAATLHIWDAEAATPGVNDALSEGIVMTSFFSPIADTGIPTARSDEAGVSFEMGRQMAAAWKEAHPDKPIVMVQLGWPNHTEVNSGRTVPFVEGVLSVDPDAENLGALDASAGQEAAKQIIVDLLTQRPEVNLIYSEASNLTVGTMAGLSQLGRGKFDNGKPLTEIVASVDFDTVEFDQVYDPELQPQGVDGPATDRDRAGSHRPHHGCGERQGRRHRPTRPRSTSTRHTPSRSGRCPRKRPRNGLTSQFGG